MARKGSQKVRTGCYTCKARKVKCDETKPACLKCSSTGRKCEGYPNRAQGCYSWDELLNPGAIIPAPSMSRTSREDRALDFFQHIVAPGLSIYPDRDFWTRLVPAALQQAPAVRHAVIAISAIYEQLEDNARDVLRSPNGRFALGHYNQALMHIGSQTNDSNSMLFLCILFVCIESIQNNALGAIEHCRHGVKILNSAEISPWAREHLLPMFVRLSIFPYFFGSTVTTFPALEDLSTPVSAPYHSLNESLAVLDLNVARSIRFIRSTDAYRQGVMFKVDFPEHTYREQGEISALLNRWLRDFRAFKEARPPATHDAVGPYANAEMKGLVAKIWVESALDKSEMNYDNQLPSFKGVVAAAEAAIASLPLCTAPPPKTKFMFDMGYMPLLYLVIIKCRVLEVRLAALEALLSLSTKNEGLWNVTTLFAIGRRIIEREHGISLDDAHAKGERPAPNAAMPPDERRIRDSVATQHTKTESNAYGETILFMRISFLYYKSNAFVFEDEWLNLGAMPGPRVVAQPGLSPFLSEDEGEDEIVNRLSQLYPT